MNFNTAVIFRSLGHRNSTIRSNDFRGSNAPFYPTRDCGPLRSLSVLRGSCLRVGSTVRGFQTFLSDGHIKRTERTWRAIVKKKHAVFNQLKAVTGI